MKRLLVLAAWLLPFPALAAMAVVPDRFVGHWAGSPDSCRSDIDDLILRIAPRHVTYWESEGPVIAVVVHAGSSISLTAELHGEGDTWLATTRYDLSADGNRLIDGTRIPGEEIVRYRCPAHAETAPGA